MDSKISGLPDGGTLLSTDQIPVNQGGTTKRVVAVFPSSTLSPIQGRLQVDTTSQISLQRFQGALIPIFKSGAWQNSTIPASGPTLSNAGLTAGTLYYVYAFDSGGVLTLEAVVTTHATDATSGVEIKSGDATRTLVGMVFMDAGTPGTFVSSITKRYCANWANRRRQALLNVFTNNRTTTSSSPVEINSEIRVSFLAWPDEAVVGVLAGSMNGGSNSSIVRVFIGVDGASVFLANAGTSYFPNINGGSSILAMQAMGPTTEGQHFLTLVGASLNGTTATWFGSANFPETTTNFERCSLAALVML